MVEENLDKEFEEMKNKKFKCRQCHVEVNIYSWGAGTVFMAMCPKCLDGIAQDADGNIIRLNQDARRR
jgi:hypothetical protein